MDDDTKPLTGAQFARKVGADPQKWAEAFAQLAAAMSESLSDGLRDQLVGFFRDAMEAAVKAAERRAQREERDFLKVGIWKPGDALDDEGGTEYPPGKPR